MNLEIPRSLVTATIYFGMIALLLNAGLCILYLFFPNLYDVKKRGAGFWFASLLLTLIMIVGYWLAWRL